MARVLVIDDEQAARYGMLRALSSHGYELREAADGPAGLAVAREFHPDVILSDINMPGMDGLTLLSRLQELDNPPLVILITAYGSERLATEALRAGAYDYIAKPYDIEELRGRVRNAAEQRRLREELKQSHAALLQAKKMSALAELAAGVAHECNTPAGALQSSLQSLRSAVTKLLSGDQRPVLRETIEETTHTALDACDRLTQVVSSLASFAQLDRADLQPFSLPDAVRTVSSLLGAQLGEGVTLRLELAPVPAIEGNPRDFNQVVLHLVRNAAAAIQRSGRPGAITVRTFECPDDIRLEVADTGDGIPPAQLATLFEPGFAVKDNRIGLGLGLPICRQVVTAHGGRIDIRSEPGAGAIVTVTIPKGARLKA
ncbi:MAG: response regulator [Bryobacteraceae bacterium]|nr:response regulator [Bryobacteraceae bacterium]